MKRRYKYGAASTIFTVVFLAVVIVLNLIVGILSQRVDLNIDMTSESLMSVSDTTYTMLDKLDRDVSINIFKNEEELSKDFAGYAENFNLVEFIKKYEKYSDRVKFNFVDLDINPSIASQYGVTDVKQIVVASDNRYKTINMEDLLAFSRNENGDTYISGIRVEQKISASIAYVAAKDNKKMGYTKTHNELDMKTYKELANNNGFENVTLDLKTDEIDEDVKFISIIAPKVDFTLDEIDKLDRFMDRGGVAVGVYLGPETPELPNLNGYMAEWGIGVTQSLVGEKSQYINNNPYFLIAQPAGHRITESMATDAYIIMPGTVNLEVLFTERDVYTTSPILNTTNDAYIEEVKGPFSIAVDSYKEIQSKNVANTSHLLVYGSYLMLDGSVLETNNFANQQFITQSFGISQVETEQFYVPAKMFNDNYLILSEPGTIIFMYVFVFALPLLFFGFGLYVYLRRKHR